MERKKHHFGRLDGGIEPRSSVDTDGKSKKNGKNTHFERLNGGNRTLLDRQGLKLAVFFLFCKMFKTFFQG